MHTVGCFSGKRCGAIVRTAQCLNGVAVMRIPACSLPLLKHRGRLCQPNKALVSNTKRHCGSSVVARSSSYHIESDGVTLVCSEVQLRSPRGILGVNLLHTAPLQARESAIISPCRWRGEGRGSGRGGFQAVPPSLCYRTALLESSLRQCEYSGTTIQQTMDDEILLKSDESCRTDGLIHQLFMAPGEWRFT